MTEDGRFKSAQYIVIHPFLDQLFPSDRPSVDGAVRRPLRVNVIGRLAVAKPDHIPHPDIVAPHASSIPEPSSLADAKHLQALPLLGRTLVGMVQRRLTV